MYRANILIALASWGLFSRKSRAEVPKEKAEDAFIRCPACNKVLHSTIPRCPYCSAFLEVKCPSCDRTTNRVLKNCPFCDEPLKDAK